MPAGRSRRRYPPAPPWSAPTADGRPAVRDAVIRIRISSNAERRRSRSWRREIEASRWSRRRRSICARCSSAACLLLPVADHEHQHAVVGADRLSNAARRQRAKQLPQLGGHLLQIDLTGTGGSPARRPRARVRRRRRSPVHLRRSPAPFSPARRPRLVRRGPAATAGKPAASTARRAPRRCSLVPAAPPGEEQDEVPSLAANRLGNLARLHLRHHLFDLLVKVLAGDPAEVATLRSPMALARRCVPARRNWRRRVPPTPAVAPAVRLEPGRPDRRPAGISRQGDTRRRSCGCGEFLIHFLSADDGAFPSRAAAPP